MIRVTEPHSNQPLLISELIDRLAVIQQQHGDLPCAIFSAAKRSSVPLIAACVSAWPMLDERKTRVMFSEQTETVVDEMVFDLMQVVAELREQLAAERGRLEYEAGAAQAALLMELADVQIRLIEAHGDAADWTPAHRPGKGDAR